MDGRKKSTRFEIKAAISKLANFLRPSSRSYVVLALVK